MHPAAAARSVASLLMRRQRHRPAAITNTRRAAALATVPTPPAAPLSSCPIHLLPIVHHPLFSAPQLPPGHRFPMQVFRRIHDRLLASKIAVPEQIVRPDGDGALPTDEDLSLVHSREYLSALSSGTLDPQRARRIGFGLDAFKDPLLMRRTRAEAEGTLLTARLALERGLAVATAGGTHHAFRAEGSGFCVVCDLAYAATRLILEGKASRVAIVDLDVHQGDGTAAIFEQEDEEEQDGARQGGGGGGEGAALVRDRVFTFSAHAASNFPARKRRSTLDLPLADGTGDAEYLSRVADALQTVLEWLQQPPPLSSPPDDAAAPPPPPLVLYDAGVDIHADDHLGRLNISDDGLRRRELLVLDTFLAAGIPVAGLVGGGYSDSLDELAERHCHLHRAALRMWREYELGAVARAGAVPAAAAAAAV